MFPALRLHPPTMSPPPPTITENNADDNNFESSDTGRSGAPLKHVQTITFEGPIKLDRGGSLPEVTVAYET